MSGLAWAVYLFAGVLADYIADRRGKGETLSENTRRVVRATPFGRWIFLSLCVAVPAWFARHILRRL